MKWAISIPALALLLATNVWASDREKATYVGDGRYVGGGKSIDDATLRQRNNERQERQYDRQRAEERYERAERRERDSDYDRQGRDWSEY